MQSQGAGGAPRVCVTASGGRASAPLGTGGAVGVKEAWQLPRDAFSMCMAQKLSREVGIAQGTSL